MRNRLYYLRFIRSIVEPDDAGSGGQGEPEPDAAPKEPDTPPSGGDEKLGEAGLKALKAERDANKAAKAKLAEYEAKLKEFADRDKTEAEKTAERLRELEKSNSTNARKALQYDVAAEKGIPLKLASRLRGDDRDAMLKDADELLSLIPHDTKPSTPKPDKSQGKGGGAKPSTLTDAIAGHYKH